MGKKLNMFIATLLSAAGAVFVIVQVASAFAGTRDDIEALPQVELTGKLVRVDTQVGAGPVDPNTGNPTDLDVESKYETRSLVGVLGIANELILTPPGAEEPNEPELSWVEFGLKEDADDEGPDACPIEEDIPEDCPEQNGQTCVEQKKHCSVCMRNAPATQACALLSVVAGVVAAAFSFLRIFSTMCSCKCGDKLFKFVGLLAALAASLFALGAFVAPLQCAQSYHKVNKDMLKNMKDGDNAWTEAKVSAPKPQAALVLAIVGMVFQLVSFGVNFATAVKDTPAGGESANLK